MVESSKSFSADENILCREYGCPTHHWTTPPPMERYTKFYDYDDEYEFYACRHCGNTTDGKLIEVKPFDDDCYMCDKNSLYTVEDLPTGAKSFCSELCYCKYAGLPYNGEGYYGLTDKSKVKEPTYLAFARKRMSKKSESFSAEKRVNWKTFPQNPDEYKYGIHWKSPIPRPNMDFAESLRSVEEGMEPYNINIEQYVVVDDKIVIYLVSFYESIVEDWEAGEYKYGRKKYWCAFAYQCEIPFSKYVELWQEHEKKYEQWNNLKIKAEKIMRKRLDKDGGNTITIAMSRELHLAYNLEPKFNDRLYNMSLSKNKMSGIRDSIPNYVNSNEYNSMSKGEVKERILKASKEFLEIEPEWIISPYEKMARRKLMTEYNNPKPYLMYGGLVALAGLALFKRKR